MSTLTFDTLSASQTLTEGDLTQKQATAITKVIKQAQDAHLEELASKGDLEILKRDIVITLGSLIIGVAGLMIAYLELRGGSG